MKHKMGFNDRWISNLQVHHQSCAKYPVQGCRKLQEVSSFMEQDGEMVMTKTSSLGISISRACSITAKQNKNCSVDTWAQDVNFVKDDYNSSSYINYSESKESWVPL